MGVSDWSHAEKELYALGTRALLDDIERYRLELSAGVELDNTSMADAVREHEQRMSDLAAQQRAWLEDFISGGTSDPASTDPQGQVGASTAGAAPATSGPGPGQPNPHAAELAEADRIRGLSMWDFQRERERLIRRDQGIFG